MNVVLYYGIYFFIIKPFSLTLTRTRASEDQNYEIHIHDSSSTLVLTE